MRPVNLKTKIFLDSGDPQETKQTLDLLGFLDGQTTNPSLVAKKLKQDNAGIKLSAHELLSEYKKIVQKISALIPKGSVSIEVYADKNSTAQQLLEQGQKMFSWIPNAHIKFPTTTAGLEAAQKAIQNKMRVNMTLVFTQQQAAAVFAATKGAKFGEVFVSPFIGRLDDTNVNGMSLVDNISKMYKTKSKNHVQVLAASIRTLPHFLYNIYAKTDIVTVPYELLKKWSDLGKPLPGGNINIAAFEDEKVYLKAEKLENIPFEDLNLENTWQEYNINHPLTDTGLEKFAADWNSLIL